MDTQHLEILETTLQKTHQWLDALSGAAHLDKHTALQSLKAVLQALRDRLPPEEAAHFAAQLPMLIRGMFYEGYQPARVPQKLSREEFLQRISEGIVSNRVVNPAEIAEQVFLLIEHFMGWGVLEKVGLALPEEIRLLFPRPSVPTL